MNGLIALLRKYHIEYKNMIAFLIPLLFVHSPFEFGKLVIRVGLRFATKVFT